MLHTHTHTHMLCRCAVVLREIIYISHFMLALIMCAKFITRILSRAIALIYLKTLLSLMEIRCHNERVVVVSFSFVSTSLSVSLHIGGELLAVASLFAVAFWHLRAS